MRNNSFNLTKKTIISIFCGFLAILLISPFIDGFYLKSAFVGFSVVAVNFSAIIWAWSRIFIKKTIALAFAVIVFKYAILGLIFYQILVKSKVDNFSFAIGISTITIFVGTLSLLAIVETRSGEI